MFKNTMPRYDVLSEDAMSTLDAGWRRLVSEVGVEFSHERALKAFRERSRRPWVPAVLAGGLLLVELFPAPRPLVPVRVPSFYDTIAKDPRPVAVMHLPVGLRDGLSSTGNFSAHAQFLQIFHGKPLVGGYLSRLPKGEVLRYRRIALLSALFDLSEERVVSEEQRYLALQEAAETLRTLHIGYVIVDVDRASPELLGFARVALPLRHLQTEGGQELYIVE
jgi:trimethylamine---corrinoid protein Co-methyltransferase